MKFRFKSYFALESKSSSNQFHFFVSPCLPTLLHVLRQCLFLLLIIKDIPLKYFLFVETPFQFKVYGWIFLFLVFFPMYYKWIFSVKYILHIFQFLINHRFVSSDNPFKIKKVNETDYANIVLMYTYPILSTLGLALMI